MSEITVKRSDDIQLTLTITDPDTGLAINITGCTVYLTIKKSPSATTNLYLASQTSHTTPLSGITTFTIPRATVNLWGVGTKYVYFIQLKDANNKVFTTADDWFNIEDAPVIA